MIAGATRGAGGVSLARHLANAGNNELVETLAGRGLIAEGIEAQVCELTSLASHSRTSTPLYHIHADPSADGFWTEDERQAYWEGFEQEFGLKDRPFAAVLHVKNGRSHEHRVYLRLRRDGVAIRLDHDYARLERLNREFEVWRGDAITLGPHSRSILKRLDDEGKSDIARAMRKSGAEDRPRPRSLVSPRERAQQERTGVDVLDLASAALAAWQVSDNGESFRAALLASELMLFRGDKVPVIVDREGCAHPLARILAKAAKARGDEQIRAGDVKARLGAIKLPHFAPGDHCANLLARAESLDSLRNDASEHFSAEIPSKTIIDGNGPPSALPTKPAIIPPIELEDSLSKSEADFSSPSHQAMEIWHEYKRTIEGRSEALDAGRRKKHPRGQGSQQPEAIHSGSEWTESDRVCGIAGGPDSRRIDPAAGIVGTANRRRDRQNRPDTRAPGTDRGEPDASARAYARSRISSWRAQRAFAWQAYGQHPSREKPETLKQPLRHFGIAVLRTTETKEERATSRSRWLAAALRQAYDLGWVPVAVVANISAIKVDPERRAVILTLYSGTCLVDRHTRIDVVGAADDVAVSELAAAAQRKGWTTVKLHGDDEFKRAAAVELGRLHPPILVQAECCVEDAHTSSYRPRM